MNLGVGERQLGSSGIEAVWLELSITYLVSDNIQSSTYNLVCNPLAELYFVVVSSTIASRYDSQTAKPQTVKLLSNKKNVNNVCVVLKSLACVNA